MSCELRWRPGLPAGPYLSMIVCCGLTGCGGYSVGGVRPPFLEDLESAPPGQDLAELLERGARAGENFRRTLVVERQGVTFAGEIAELIVQFTEEAPQHLEGRRSLESFTPLVAGEIERRVIGLRALSAAEAYGGFSGKWYGLWTDFEVDHHWGEVVDVSPPLEVAIPPGEPPVNVVSWQYAWVGDGYGLNLVASADLGGGQRRFLLGYVVHFRDGDPRRVRERRPHVGVLVGPGKLIWITAEEVFLEEAFRTADGSEGYAITGFFYKTTEQALRSEKGFQAVYTRDPSRRPAWFGFPLRLKVERAAPGDQSSPE